MPVEGVDAFSRVFVVGSKAFVELRADEAIALSNVFVQRRKWPIAARRMKP